MLQAFNFEFNGAGRLASYHDFQHHCPADFTTPNGPETGIYLWGLNALYLSTLGKLGLPILSSIKEFSQQLQAALALQQLRCPKQSSSRSQPVWAAAPSSEQRAATSSSA